MWLFHPSILATSSSWDLGLSCLRTQCIRASSARPKDDSTPSTSAATRSKRRINLGLLGAVEDRLRLLDGMGKRFQRLPGVSPPPSAKPEMKALPPDAAHGADSLHRVYHPFLNLSLRGLPATCMKYINLWTSTKVTNGPAGMANSGPSRPPTPPGPGSSPAPQSCGLSSGRLTKAGVQRQPHQGP